MSSRLGFWQCLSGWRCQVNRRCYGTARKPAGHVSTAGDVPAAGDVTAAGDPTLSCLWHPLITKRSYSKICARGPPGPAMHREHIYDKSITAQQVYLTPFDGRYMLSNHSSYNAYCCRKSYHASAIRHTIHDLKIRGAITSALMRPNVM